MKCLSESQLNKYASNSLPGVEASIARDHILSCRKCKNAIELYKQIEDGLNDPVMKNPPAIIEKNVMKKLYPKFSYISSILTLVAVSFLMLVAGIYIYFDFANDSIIKAFQLTGVKTTSIIASGINFITGIFSGLYAIFKALNTFFEVIFKVKIGVEVTGFGFAFILMLLFYFVYNKVIVKIRESK
ncbi:MAG: hypothetical protein ABFR75_11720 [Acidobacteriota bacterium]